METINIQIPTSHEEVEFEVLSKQNTRASFGDYDGYGIDKAAAF